MVEVASPTHSTACVTTPQEARLSRIQAIWSPRRDWNTSAAPYITAAQVMPSSAMVTESTEKTRQKLPRPTWTPGICGIGRSPMRPRRISNRSTAPTIRQTMPGTMKAARQE